MTTKTNITAYSEGTPNGLKIHIALEELGLEYKLVQIDMFKNEQKEPWFTEINPNGRIPAITDVTADGVELKIFESGAILEYLVATYDKNHLISYPYATKEHWETISWLMWQMGGLGPMLGQANFFTRSAVGVHQYSIDRFVNESRRLLRVLDGHLQKKGCSFLVGDRLTIADIAIWPWVSAIRFSGLRAIEDFPNVSKWFWVLLERPGFQKGANIPGPNKYLATNKMTEEEMNKLAEPTVKWIAESMKRDAEA
ncbi:glutathione S-transferase [Chaetomium strumarium]|uniref:Glutathione S-transferase n=1 Tax=Chaetomium strumarium TaxID=1170767 RepID=A0AAJ0GRX3_9PEZI|nr:glutathione S-transferase [Chaetomium strumarium]